RRVSPCRGPLTPPGEISPTGPEAAVEGPRGCRRGPGEMLHAGGWGVHEAKAGRDRAPAELKVSTRAEAGVEGPDAIEYPGGHEEVGRSGEPFLGHAVALT